MLLKALVGVLLLFPISAYAYSSVILSDPGFLEFFFTKFVLNGGASIAFIEAAVLRCFVKYPYVKLLSGMLVANYAAMLGTTIIGIFIIVPMVGNVIMGSPPIVEYITWGYFAMLTIHMGFLAKRKALRDHMEDLEYKPLKWPLFIINALTLGFFWVLIILYFVAP